MMHPFTTQANESLNMRLAELAPKYKNYSRTKTLDYLQQMVIAHHNVGIHQYYSNVFEHLEIPFTNHLSSYLKRRQEWKIRKKELDGDPKNKAIRKWRYQAKDKEAMLKETTQKSKEGTYETGVAMKNKNNEGAKGDLNTKKKKEREYCNCGGPFPHKNKNSKHCIARKINDTDAGPANNTST